MQQISAVPGGYLGKKDRSPADLITATTVFVFLAGMGLMGFLHLVDWHVTFKILANGSLLALVTAVSLFFSFYRPFTAYSAERSRAEEQLRTNKEFVETVLDAINDAISIIDTDGYTIVGVNRAFLNEYGVAPEEVVGKTCYAVTHHLDLPCSKNGELCPLAETVLNRRPAAAEHEHRSKDGTSRFVEIRTLPIIGRDEEVRQVVHVARDITERRKAQADREQLIVRQQEILAQVRTLRGLLPICASCKKIRDDRGYWRQIEEYIRDHSDAEFSHGICPECVNLLYSDLGLDKK